jgi:hypothetical protein
MQYRHNVCLPAYPEAGSQPVLAFLIHSGPGGSDSAQELSQRQNFSRSTKSRTDKHTYFTEARRPGFAMGCIGLFLAPAKTLSWPTQRKMGDNNSPSGIEEGHIKIITVVEQEVGDESENSS